MCLSFLKQSNYQIIFQCLCLYKGIIILSYIFVGDLIQILCVIKYSNQNSKAKILHNLNFKNEFKIGFQISVFSWTYISKQLKNKPLHYCIEF